MSLRGCQIYTSNKRPLVLKGLIWRHSEPSFITGLIALFLFQSQSFKCLVLCLLSRVVSCLLASSTFIIRRMGGPSVITDCHGNFEISKLPLTHFLKQGNTSVKIHWNIFAWPCDIPVLISLCLGLGIFSVIPRSCTKPVVRDLTLTWETPNPGYEVLASISYSYVFVPCYWMESMFGCG